MRVLHIAEAFAGGAMEIVLTLSDRLSDEGHDVAIAYGRRPETPEDIRPLVDPRVELFATPWTSRTLSAHIRSWLYLRRLIRTWKPDVVHLHSSFAGVAGVIAVGNRAPTAYTPQGYSFAQDGIRSIHRHFFIAVERFVAHRVTLLGASSAQEAELGRSLAGAKRVVVTYNGVRELDDPAGRSVLPPARPRVIALGRLAPQRQPAATARILAAVADLADVEWVGAKVNDPAQAAVVRDAGVALTGWVTRAEALQQLATTDVYLHWSAWDGHPVTVLEAMSRDAIVIASNIPPNLEILGPDQVFDSEDDAIEAIRAVLTDDSRRQQFLDSQRERRGQFSARRMTTQWLELYEGLAAKASISRG